MFSNLDSHVKIGGGGGEEEGGGQLNIRHKIKCKSSV